MELRGEPRGGTEGGNRGEEGSRLKLGQDHLNCYTWRNEGMKELMNGWIDG